MLRWANADQYLRSLIAALRATELIVDKKYGAVFKKAKLRIFRLYYNTTALYGRNCTPDSERVISSISHGKNGYFRAQGVRRWVVFIFGSGNLWCKWTVWVVRNFVLWWPWEIFGYDSRERHASLEHYVVLPLNTTTSKYELLRDIHLYILTSLLFDTINIRL